MKWKNEYGTTFGIGIARIVYTECLWGEETKMYCKKFDLDVMKDDIICTKCLHRKTNGFCKYMRDKK